MATLGVTPGCACYCTMPPSERPLYPGSIPGNSALWWDAYCTPPTPVSPGSGSRQLRGAVGSASFAARRLADSLPDTTAAPPPDTDPFAADCSNYLCASLSEDGTSTMPSYYHPPSHSNQGQYENSGQNNFASHWTGNRGRRLLPAIVGVLLAMVVLAYYIYLHYRASMRANRERQRRARERRLARRIARSANGVQVVEVDLNERTAVVMDDTRVPFSSTALENELGGGGAPAGKPTTTPAEYPDDHLIPRLVLLPDNTVCLMQEASDAVADGDDVELTVGKSMLASEGDFASTMLPVLDASLIRRSCGDGAAQQQQSFSVHRGVAAIELTEPASAGWRADASGATQASSSGGVGARQVPRSLAAQESGATSRSGPLPASLEVSSCPVSMAHTENSLAEAQGAHAEAAEASDASGGQQTAASTRWGSSTAAHGQASLQSTPAAEAFSPASSSRSSDSDALCTARTPQVEAGERPVAVASGSVRGRGATDAFGSDSLGAHTAVLPTDALSYVMVDAGSPRAAASADAVSAPVFEALPGTHGAPSRPGFYDLRRLAAQEAGDLGMDEEAESRTFYFFRITVQPQ